jgi:hypothetical protein
MLLKFLKSFFLVLLASIACDSLYSQETDMRKKIVLERFDSDQEILWVKYFRGYLDKRFVCDILLASDGEQVHGAMLIDLDTFNYFLDGVIEDGTMILEETDVMGLELGWVGGTFNGTDFKGTWKNKRGDLQFSFEFTEVKRFKQLKRVTPRLLHFNTKSPELSGHWSIYTDNDQVLQGSFINSDGEYHQVRPRQIDENGDWLVHLIHQDGVDVKTLLLDLNRGRIYWLDLDDPGSFIAIKQFNEIDIFSATNTYNFHEFISEIQVLDEFKKFKIYLDEKYQPWLQSRTKPVYDDFQRGQLVLRHFFVPVYLDHQMMNGLFVVSTYDVLQGHSYHSIPCYVDLKRRQIFHPEAGMDQIEQSWGELYAIADIELDKMKHQGMWSHAAVFLEPSDFRHLFVTPYGCLIGNNYNAVTGLILLPVNDSWSREKGIWPNRWSIRKK